MTHSLVLHALIAVLSLYLFIVFAWWWKVAGDATKIYKINCFLMLGLFANHSIAVAKYWLVMFCDNSLGDVYAWYMAFQQYFLIVPLLCYVAHANRKLKGERYGK